MSRASIGTGLIWLSGFAACGAVKVAFEGELFRLVSLVATAVACALLAKGYRERSA